MFLFSIDGTVLCAAFDALRNGFPQSIAADQSWVLNAYTIAYAALLVPAGGFSDALGRKRVFQHGLLLLWARRRPNPTVGLSLFAYRSYCYFNMAKPDIVLFTPVRTPVAIYGGTPKHTLAIDLGTAAICEAP